MGTNSIERDEQKDGATDLEDCQVKFGMCWIVWYVCTSIRGTKWPVCMYVSTRVLYIFFYFYFYLYLYECMYHARI